MHDEAKLLTKDRIEQYRLSLDNSELINPAFENVEIVSISTADSKEDPRIQIADLVSGIGRRVAEDALRGKEHFLLNSMRPFIDPNSLWGDQYSWSLINGTRL